MNSIFICIVIGFHALSWDSVLINVFIFKQPVNAFITVLLKQNDECLVLKTGDKWEWNS